jgi:PAS domain S-box-containing protein
LLFRCLAHLGYSGSRKRHYTAQNLVERLPLKRAGQTTSMISGMSSTTRQPSVHPWVWQAPPFVAALLGLLLVALQANLPSCPLLVQLALLVAAFMLAPLPIRIFGAAPIGLLALPLTTTWLTCGPVVAAALAVAATLFGQRLKRWSNLPIGWQLAGELLGVGLGSALGGLLGAQLGSLVEHAAARGVVEALGFAFGLWAGENALASFTLRPPDLPRARLLGLLTSLVLAPPSAFLAQIGMTTDPLLFAASLGIALGLILLVRATTNSEARNLELSAEIASTTSAREHLELIVDHAPEAIIAIDERGMVDWINRTATEWLGAAAQSAVGRPANQVFQVRGVSGSYLNHAALVERAAQSGRPVHEEGELFGSAAAPERVLLSYSAQRDDGTRLVLLRDASEVTESLREQEELAVHLSHELRAPLTTILGYAQLMSSPLHGQIEAGSSAEFARRISESGDYMLRLVNNLLDLGRLGKVDTERLPTSTVDVVALTGEVVEAQRPQAGEKAQTLSVQLPTTSPSVVTSDLAVRQILTNLVSNAIKYTPPGGEVRVELEMKPSAVAWRVIDTGIGISPEEQAKLFTRFFRSQRPEARLTKGTGLGLALARALAERLGGTITVQSAVDQGSTFSFTLPLLPSPDAPR